MERSRSARGLIAHAGQGRDGCDRRELGPASPPPDRWGQRAGRLFLTSLSILTLEVYYRYLPLYRDYDEDQENEDPLLKEDPKPARAPAKKAAKRK